LQARFKERRRVTHLSGGDGVAHLLECLELVARPVDQLLQVVAPHQDIFLHLVHIKHLPQDGRTFSVSYSQWVRP
jgi:hypothetical protein